MKIRKTINIKMQLGIMKYIILSFIFMPPMIISVWPKTLMLSTAIEYIAIIESVIIIIIELSKARKSNVWISILFFMLWMLICNFINWSLEGLIHYFKIFIPLVGYVTLIHRCFRRNEENAFLTGSSIYYVIICILNLISQLIFTEGIYHDYSVSWQGYYICGNGNSFIFFYLISAAVLIFNSIYKRKKISLFVVTFEIMLVYSMTLADSSTGLVVCLLLFIFTNTLTKWAVKLLKTYYKFLLLIVVPFIIWFLGFDGWNNQWIKEIIYKYIGESASFIARGTIWNNAINNFLKNPIWGYGTENVLVSVDANGIARSAHNTYLQILLYGGILAFILFINVLIKGLRCLRDKNIFGTQYFILIIFLYLIVFLFEQNPFYMGFYAIIMIAYCFVFYGNKIDKMMIKT